MGNIVCVNCLEDYFFKTLNYIGQNVIAVGCGLINGLYSALKIVNRFKYVGILVDIIKLIKENEPEENP